MVKGEVAFNTVGGAQVLDKKHFLSKERTCAKKDYSFGKAFLSKKRFVLKEKQIIA